MLPPTAMKLMAMGASAKAGIAGVNKQLGKMSPEARAEKVRAKEKAKQDKDIAKGERQASREFLRSHGSLLQKMADGLKTKSALQKAEEEQIERLNKRHTEKIQKQIDDEKQNKFDSDWDEATKEELMGTGAENARKDSESKEKKSKKKDKEEESPSEDLSPSLDPVSAASAPKIPGTDSGENELAEIIKPVVVGEAMVVHNDPLEELLAIGKTRLILDERREDREIKEDRRALEDRRDKRGMGGIKKLGSPTLKKKDGGILSSIGKTLMSLGTKYLLPIATSVAGLAGLKKFLTNTDKADDAAKVVTKLDELAKGVKTVAPHVDEGLKGVAKTTQLASHVKNAGLADDALKGVAKTTELGKKVTLADDALSGVAKSNQIINHSDEIVKVGTKVDDGLKGVAKANQIVSYTDDFAKLTTHVTTSGSKAMQAGTKVTLVDDALSGVAKSNQIINHSDEIAKIGTKVDDGLKAGVKATNLINYSDDFTKLAGQMDNLGSQVTKIDEGVKAVHATTRLNSAGRLIDSKTGKFVKGADAAVDIAQDGAKVSGVANNVQSLAAGADNVAANSDEAAKALAGTLRTGGNTAGKLLGRLAKVLTPLDIFAKMEQGQGLGESVLNMGAELGGMAVGLADVTAELNSKALSWLTGGFMTESGQGLLGNKDSDGLISEGTWGDRRTALDAGDVFDNEKKWNTHLLEQGINSAVASITGTEKVANKKQWTEEQEALAKAAEDTGAVDLNYLGPSDIDDLEAVTLLDPASLQALLDFKVWDDKDMKMLEDIRDAKKEGRSVKYNDNGWLGREGVDFGEKGAPVKNKNGQSLDASGNMKYIPDGGEYGMPRGEGNTSDAGRQEAIDRIMGEQSYVEMGSNRDKVLTDRLHKLQGMSAEEFNALTPNVKTQDKFFSDAINPGSIYTHDTHVEALLQKLVPTDSNPSVASEMLETKLVTAQMTAAKQSQNQAVNAQVNSNIDNSVKNNNVTNVPSTAHAPFSPSGAGVMGINTPRG
tara:strand:+ start:13287 stop:16289 length:3003 start_codon:yes stop_codon:yes gene_type:complete